MIGYLKQHTTIHFTATIFNIIQLENCFLKRQRDARLSHRNHASVHVELLKYSHHHHYHHHHHHILFAKVVQMISFTIA